MPHCRTLAPVSPVRSRGTVFPRATVARRTVRDPNLVLALFGAIVLALGLTADLIKQHTGLLSAPLFAVAYGVLVGPDGLGLLVVSAWGEPLAIVEQVARLTVGLAVMTAALRLPPRYVLDRARTMAAALLVVMPLMWLTVALLAWAILGVGWAVALLVAAVVTPTDPVVSASIVTGTTAEEHVPARLRDYVTAESGINDGVAYLFVFLSILVLEAGTTGVLREWLVGVLVGDVLAASLVGAAVGYGVGLLQNWTRRFGDEPDAGLLAVPIVLALGVLGLVKLLGADDVLAAFVAGVAFHVVVTDETEAREAEASEVAEWLLELPLFVLFGAILPWHAWRSWGWVAVAFALAVVALRRLPVVPVASRFQPVDRLGDAAFVSWFGPVGVAAVFYATLAARHTGSELVWHVCSLVVAVSILVYGVSATPLTQLYGRRVGAAGDGAQ